MNRRAWILGSLFALQPALAQAAVFVLIDGIPGAVTTQAYLNWHHGTSFNWAFDKANTTLPFKLDIVMPLRSANFASIKQAAFNGAGIKRIVIDHTATVSTGASPVATRLTCDGAVITAMALSSQGENTPTAQLQLGCAKVLWEDFEYSSSGTFLRSVKGETTLIAK